MTSQFPPTSYINAGMMLDNKDVIGKTVRLVGKVLGVAVGSAKAQVESSDGRTITIVRPKDSMPYESTFVCITGTVQADGSLSEGTFESFGDKFNLDTFNRTIELMQRSSGSFHLLAC